MDRIQSNELLKIIGKQKLPAPKTIRTIGAILEEKQSAFHTGIKIYALGYIHGIQAERHRRKQQQQ